MLYKGVFAVTRVEQRAIEVANVSLLALYKEGQSDPDPPPWTLIIHHPNSAMSLESPTCDRGSDQRPLSGAASQSTPSLRRSGTHRTLTPSLSLSMAVRVQ